MKHKLLNLFLILLGTFSAFLLAEFSLRMIQFFGERNLFNLKPIYSTLVWQNQKNFRKFILNTNQQGWFVTPSGEYQTLIKTNSEGFYDINHKIEKPQNTYRIILLGDSFVANLQSPIEQTVGKEIEKKLNNKNLGKKIEVIPIGLGDTGSTQQLFALEEIGFKYNPDLVIQFFFTANDIKNNSLNLQKDLYRDYFLLENGSLRLAPEVNKENNFFKKQLKKSKLVERLLYLRQIYLDSDKNNTFPIDYQIYQKVLNPDYQKAWEVTQKLILETKKQSEQKNSKYLLVTLANNEQVNSDVWQEIKTKYPKLNSSGIDLENPDNLVKDFCLAENIECLKLLPIFKNYSIKSSNPTHYKYDGHWNDKGIEIASSAITEYLFNMDYFSIK